MQEGLILKSIGGFYYVKSGAKIYECKPRGIFRKEGISPVVGDKVEISIINEERREGVIEKIFERKTFLNRPLVANMNQVILVFAVKSPEPDLLLMDKILIKAEALNIKPIICINKIDLGKELTKQFECYLQAGYLTIFTSAAYNIGIEKIKDILKGKMTILAGPSGVGKSTIINKLFPEKKVEIGDLSEKIKRGKHTTRHVELYEIEGEGYIADTPGFSLLELDNISSKELKSFYPEFKDFYINCKYTGCNHISEPMCAVKDAVERKIIDIGRYSRYKEIFNYLVENEEY